MFFVLSKTVGFFTLPSNLFVALAVVGLALSSTRVAWLGRRVLAIGVLLLTVAGFSPAGNLLMYPLEQRFPVWHGATADGIVVLGGSVNPEISAERGTPALNETAERLTIVATLAREFPAARIVYSGGNADLFGSEIAEADFVADLFVSFGVARERIVLERKSRNTLENAIFTKALVTPKPGEHWLLVTSAYHMPRSVAAFRAADFPVEPYPVDWRIDLPGDLFLPFTTFSAGLARSDAAVREWVGLLAYRLSGKSPVLFPKP